MKIGVYTLPFTWNYGGILQHYALRTFLAENGHEVELLYRRTDAGLLRNICKRIKWFFIPILGCAKIFRNFPLIEVERFKRRYINQSPLFFTTRSLSKYCSKSHFDAIVVGSDQVWRYGSAQDIPSSFLCFAGDETCKIAYAVSFGKDEWNYPDALTAECRELVKKFCVVTVRESSGLRLCQEHLNVEAQIVLDPTLLIGKSGFARIIADAGYAVKNNGGIYTYILDSSSEKTKLIHHVEEVTGSRVSTLAAIGNGRGVAEWIYGFANADYVVTDSFHGMCFALLFNKPFVAIVNWRRGAARFNSLAKLLGIENQLIYDLRSMPVGINFNINWAKVNEALEKERMRSARIILHALEPSL